MSQWSLYLIKLKSGILEIRSEDVLRIRVDLLESSGRTLVHNTFCLQAVVLVKVIFRHALSESNQLGVAEIFQDLLSGRAIILSWEAISENGFNKHDEYDDLQNDSLIDESRLFLGSTEHVAHIFSWHVEKKT